MFKPRPYQNAAVESVVSKYQSGKRKLLLHLPTGAGKTVIATLLIERFLAMPGIRRVLFLAHRKEIIDQTAEKIQRHLGHGIATIEQADRKAGSERVVVASVQSLSQRLQSFDPADFSVVIADECHHVYAKTWTDTIAWFQKKSDTLLLGMTATPRRTDGRSADQAFGEVAYEISLDTLQDLGYLVPMDYYTVEANLGLGDVEISQAGDFQASVLGKIMNTPEVRAITIRAWKERAAGKKTIAFCASVSHAEELAREFSRIGIGARHITGYTKSRDELLEAFRAGDLQVITNFGVLTEGFDDPSIECVLLARPTTSPLVYSQCLGRGLRSHPGKKLCTVIDIIDRTTHRLQYNAYEAAGFKAGWKPSGKDPLREAKAIARIRVTDPAVFLKIKNALSLAETQAILMSLPDGKVLSGLDGGPLVRYETAAESEVIKDGEALQRVLAIASQHSLDLRGVHCNQSGITLILPPAGWEKLPSFFDWHIANATGIKPEIFYAATERTLIEEPEGERLKTENPKGRVLELEMSRKVDDVEIRVWESPTGFEAQGSVKMWDGFYKTPICWSRTKKKHAEQGAAHDLFRFLGMHLRFEIQTPREPKAPVQLLPSDSRARLNEMVQRKILASFGYDELGKSGADHESIFHMRAWADIPGRQRHLGPIVEARSKKEAQAKAAALLYEGISQLDKEAQAKPTIIKPNRKMQTHRNPMEIQQG